MEIARELRALLAQRAGGSVIVIGPPGAGKTAMLKQVLGEEMGCSALWLDGLFSNDFGVNLLRLFQHFQLASAASTDLNTFEELSDALLRRHCGQQLPFSVIVIEWLDMFVDAGGSSGQQLLYGLLELTAVLPILVVGLTRRVDVVEGMEKRVRSRFSQNVLYLPPDHNSLAPRQGAKSLLSLQGHGELSGPELLVLACFVRLLSRNCSRISASTLLFEYCHGLRVETGACLLTSAQLPGQSAVAGERQLLRAIESLIYRGVIKYARNDCMVERQFRLLTTCVPSFVLPELITRSPSCPIPIKMMATRHS